MKPSVTELFRRGIVVPQTQDALRELRSDDIKDQSRFKVIEFPDDEQFYRIWNAGVFQEINRTCGTMIDDYESEEVINDLDTLTAVLEASISKRSFLDQDKRLLQQIRDLAVEANTLKTSLFFIL